MSGIVGPRLSTIPPTFFDDYSFEFGGGNTCVVFQPTLNIDATNGLTLSFWVKLNISAAWDYVISAGSSGVDSQLNLRWNAGGGLTSWIVGSSQATGINTGYGAWRHIVMTINYSNGDVKFYMDGVVSSTVLTFGSNYANAKLNTIGAYNSTGINPTDGLIDEVSVFRSVFDQTAITNLYNDGKPTDLTSLSPHVWIRMGDNAIYKSPQWLLPSNENKDKVSNYSMSFDGSNDYIDCGVVNQVQTFSVSMWVNPLNWGASRVALQMGQSSNYGLSFWFMIDGTLRCLGSNGTNDSYFGNTVANADTYLPSGSWGHILFTHEQTGTGATQKIYINGILRNTYVSTTHPYIVNYLGNPLYIAKRNNNTYFWQGNIGPVALFDNDQSANASTIYNSGTPTDLTSLNPIAYYKMGENATFKDSQWLLPSNENKDKISNYSMSFDGTNDWINCGRDSSLDFNNAITISAWIKTDATVGTTVMPILFKDSTGAGTRCYSLGFRPLSAGYDKAYIGIFHTNGNNTSVYTSTAGALSNGNWHHLMGTYDGTDNTDALKIYVDGVLDNTATPTPGDTGIHIKTNVDVAIGSISHGVSWWWEGGIDDVAVWGTDQSSNISFIYSGGTGGTPPDLSSLNPISYWKMGEDATFSTNWTVPDQIGINDGTSANMDINDRVGESPGSSGNTVSFNMDINDRIGDAPSSSGNALSYNMVLSGRTTDVPT